MTDDEIIEAGAEGLFKHNAPSGTVPWDGQSEAVKQPYRDKFRASLAALRAHGLEVVPVEPTEAMIEAAFNTMTGSERDYGTTIKKEWAAMITAATPTAGK